MKIDELETQLDNTLALTGTMKKDCLAYQRVINDAVWLLNKPQEVDRALKLLSTGLGELSTGLTVSKVVRPLRLVAGRLQRSVDVLKRKVDTAESKTKVLAQRVKPLRNSLRRLSSRISIFIRKLDRFTDKTRATLTAIRTVRKGINALPEAPRNLGYKQLNAYADFCKPPVILLNRSLAQTDKALLTDTTKIHEINKKLDQLSQAQKQLLSVQKRIDPVMKPLRKLLQALNRRINLKVFSFSVRQIIDGIKLPRPFRALERRFWDLANRILDPILKTLRLNIKLPDVPGLAVLNQINLDVFDRSPNFPAMFDDLTGMFDNLTSLFALFKVSCPPRASAPATPEMFAAQLTSRKAGARAA